MLENLSCWGETGAGAGLLPQRGQTRKRQGEWRWVVFSTSKPPLISSIHTDQTFGKPLLRLPLAYGWDTMRCGGELSGLLCEVSAVWDAFPLCCLGPLAVLFSSMPLN